MIENIFKWHMSFRVELRNYNNKKQRAFGWEQGTLI